jgi:hypothetical protein
MDCISRPNPAAVEHDDEKIETRARAITAKRVKTNFMI